MTLRMLGNRQVSWNEAQPCRKAVSTLLRRTPRARDQRLAETRVLAAYIARLLRIEPRTKVQLIALTNSLQSDIEAALAHLKAVQIAPTFKNRPRYALPNT